MTVADYQYDLFLSYPRQPRVGAWTREVLKPELEEILAGSMLRKPRVFCDEGMERGGGLTERLKAAVKVSRCMLTVWDCHFFRSRWCMAEWHSMRKREELLGLGQDGSPALVYPLVFRDGDSFPAEARDTVQQRCMKDYNHLSRKREASLRWDDFLRLLEDQVAADLVRWIQQAPAFDPTWPVIEPEPLDDLALGLASRTEGAP